MEVRVSTSPCRWWWHSTAQHSTCQTFNSTLCMVQAACHAAVRLVTLPPILPQSVEAQIKAQHQHAAACRMLVPYTQCHCSSYAAAVPTTHLFGCLPPAFIKIADQVCRQVTGELPDSRTAARSWDSVAISTRQNSTLAASVDCFCKVHCGLVCPAHAHPGWILELLYPSTLATHAPSIRAAILPVHSILHYRVLAVEVCTDTTQLFDIMDPKLCICCLSISCSCCCCHCPTSLLPLQQRHLWC